MTTSIPDIRTAEDTLRQACLLADDEELEAPAVPTEPVLGDD